MAVAALVVAIVSMSIALVCAILGVLDYRRDRPRLLAEASGVQLGEGGAVPFM